MHRKRNFGFTLVELLVVFAIMGLLIGVVPAALSKLREAVVYRQTVQDMTTLLRTARQQAITRGIYTAVLVNPQAGMYGLEGANSEKLDKSLHLNVETASIANRENGVQSILFLPQGGSTGGSISIVRTKPGSGVRLRVDWLSGLVTQEVL
ncbi:GspH/FimT family pseudopilin [Comamonas sp.]|uniref:GspH/FimT family pseudopilin n=1 Tax=Comamonas sp. TaxID=34028 RepID=UPI00258408E4|nr:GspH/FimT family pseudopilin [Comamonas sp.]